MKNNLKNKKTKVSLTHPFSLLKKEERKKFIEDAVPLDVFKLSDDFFSLLTNVIREECIIL